MNYGANNSPSIIDAKDNGGCTALHDACYLRHINSIKILIDRGANPYEKDNNGKTPIDRTDPETRNFIESYLTPIKEPNTF